MAISLGHNQELGTPSSNILVFRLTLPRITLHFKDSKGTLLKTVEANEGDDILSIAHEHDIDLEGKKKPCSFNSFLICT